MISSIAGKSQLTSMIWKIEAFELFSVFRFGYPYIYCSLNFLIGTTTRPVPDLIRESCHTIYYLYITQDTRRACPAIILYWFFLCKQTMQVLKIEDRIIGKNAEDVKANIPFLLNIIKIKIFRYHP